METEIEAKFLGVEVDEFRHHLQAAGAHLVHGVRLMRRQTFDFSDSGLSSIGGWVRLRDEGDKVTLSYKQLNDRTLHGTKEIAVVVDSYERALEFLQTIGLQVKAKQETKRERWDLQGCEVTIDTWPWIPPFVELEAGSEQQVKAAAAALGLDWAQALHGSVEVAYQAYFDVTEEEIDHWPEIRFGDTPDWLAKRRRPKT